MANGASDDEISFTYDLDEEYEPAETIVRAVAWAKNVEPDDLQPLGSIIDPDALAELLDRPGGPTYRRPTTPINLRVVFRFEDCQVQVYEDAVIVNQPI